MGESEREKRSEMEIEMAVTRCLLKTQQLRIAACNRAWMRCWWLMAGGC